MKMSSGFNFTLNPSALKALEAGTAKAVMATAEAVKTEVVNAQVVPFDSGDTQKSMDVEGKSKYEATITVSTPYARRIYFHPEYNFRTTNNPNAKGKWFEDWLPGGDNEDFAKQAFAKFYKQYSGGVIK